jgi:thiol-disulfide isomerase/thioredoxin
MSLVRKTSTAFTIGIVCLAVAAVAVVLYILWRRNQPTEKSEENQEAESQNPHMVPSEEHSPENKAVLVLFWSEGCGICVNFHPTWEKIKEILNQKGSKVVAIDFNPSVEPQVFMEAKKHLQHFEGVPDIRLFPQGFDFNKPSIKYSGPDRSEKNILKFAYSNI